MVLICLSLVAKDVEFKNKNYWLFVAGFFFFFFENSLIISWDLLIGSLVLVFVSVNLYLNQLFCQY